MCIALFSDAFNLTGTFSACKYLKITYNEFLFNCRWHHSSVRAYQLMCSPLLWHSSSWSGRPVGWCGSGSSRLPLLSFQLPPDPWEGITVNLWDFHEVEVYRRPVLTWWQHLPDQSPLPARSRRGGASVKLWQCNKSRFEDSPILVAQLRSSQSLASYSQSSPDQRHFPHVMDFKK